MTEPVVRPSLRREHNCPREGGSMKARICVAVLLWAAVALAATPAVDIKEYDVPTPNSRPHDPALAPDGSLWYTGQVANKLGRLDPKTGQIKEYALKTP